ncbi:MAG: DUF4126 domain-containing protein [Pseudomonadota bacterium]
MPALDTLQLVSLAAALGWASGIRLYLVLFVVGLVGYMGWYPLPAHLQLLAHPTVLIASGAMVAVEFVADKVPWFDSVWDAIHTFIRIPAGAALAAGVFGDSGAASAMAAAIIGGSLAAGSHVSKAGARAIANTSPEPFSNWGLSLGEDVVVALGLLLALTQPWVFLALLLVLVLLMLWLLPKLWRAACGVLRRLKGTSVRPSPAAQ